MRQKITMTKQTDLDVRQAYNLFVRKAEVRNLSKYTLKTYGYHYDAFTEFLRDDTPIEDITSDTVDGFIIYLRENRHVNEITINSYLRTIRSFLYYCMNCGYMESFKIGMIKTEKKIKETYTNAELERLLVKPNLKECSFTEYKTWVFENYLLGTGNRITSALNVKIEDINFIDNTIFIRRTKNKRQQVIPLSKTLADILTEYLQIRGGEPENYLFCNVYGEQGTRRAYQDLVAKYNIARDVNKTSCHLFRHTFAKNWILAGGDVFRLQKILGHSDLEVTKEYVQMFGQDLQMDFEKFNPLDNLSQKQTRITM